VCPDMGAAGGHTGTSASRQREKKGETEGGGGRGRQAQGRTIQRRHLAYGQCSREQGQGGHTDARPGQGALVTPHGRLREGRVQRGGDGHGTRRGTHRRTHTRTRTRTTRTRTRTTHTRTRTRIAHRHALYTLGRLVTAHLDALPNIGACGGRSGQWHSVPEQGAVCLHQGPGFYRHHNVLQLAPLVLRGVGWLQHKGGSHRWPRQGTETQRTGEG
jgi:hypothetical protein